MLYPWTLPPPAVGMWANPRGRVEILEMALHGSRRYWGWLGLLAVCIGVGGYCYSWQLQYGLAITGLSRDVSWGFYVAQLTFLVGIAASAVMLVLPYYLHNYKVFGRLTIIGEFVAMAALVMCLLFLFVDLGKPTRALNIFLYPTPNSIIFWEVMVLLGYLGLNALVGWTCLEAEPAGRGPSGLGQTLGLSGHSLGLCHSYGNGLSVLRPAGPGVLADRLSWRPDFSPRPLPPGQPCLSSSASSWKNIHLN